VVAHQVQEVGLHAQEVRLRGDWHILEEEAEKKISEVCAVENKKWWHHRQRNKWKKNKNEQFSVFILQFWFPVLQWIVIFLDTVERTYK
jgi:hypothetical protein